MRRLLHLWRNLVRKEDIDQEIDAELRSYLELAREEKIRADSTHGKPTARHSWNWEGLSR